MSTKTIKDYRTHPFLLSTAFASLNIYRSEDGTNWALAEKFKESLPHWPQAITLSRPQPARYYKLEVTGLVNGTSGMRTYEIESFTGPAIHDAAVDSSELKTGQICRLTGRVVGAKDPRSLTVAAAASNHVQSASAPARADPAGAFSLSLIPLSCGIVPTVLELRDEQGSVVDRRTILFKAAPRVVPTDARVDREGIRGHLLNTGAAGVSLKVGTSRESVSLGTLAPGKSLEFRVPETTQGGGPQVLTVWVTEDGRITTGWVFPAERSAIVQEGHLQNQQVHVAWSAHEGKLRFEATPIGARGPIRTSIDASFDGSPVTFSAYIVEVERVILWGRYALGSLECRLELIRSGLRASFRNIRHGLQQQEGASGILALRLRPEQVSFRFMPAYVYSKEPIRYFEGVYGKQPLILGGWFPPTRMLALETAAGTIGLVPDRDRCLMGIDQDDGLVNVRIGAEPVEISVPTVAGDWFECFRYVVTDVFKFTEPRQYRPLIESVSGEANYLAHNEDIWSRGMQVVTSFPKQDYVYTFYGLTYTIPALLAWYHMTGDEQALDRVRKCVRWMLEYPGVRSTEGRTAGAFFSQYVSPDLRTFKMGSLSMPLAGLGGCDQANNRWLEPHATGAAAWTLLHYYAADGKRDRAVLDAAKEGLDWLLKIQNSDGGWCYAYRPDGAKLTEQEDAGNIWNIWALFRYGKLSGKTEYLDAAGRAKDWFASKFLAKYICRGYWEDVSGGNGRVALSWEAYEFGIAANTFGEMGENKLAVEAARNAVTWIWTRVVDCREYSNSYGHAHEQWNWPPATYVAPMFGLAAQTAFRLTGDELFRRFAGAAKTIGWWTVRKNGRDVWPRKAAITDVGGAFWPLEGTEFVPLEEPFDVTFWVDWISAQQCTICLRWLVQEVNLRSAGKISVDPETLAGTILGKPGKVTLKPDEFRLMARHEQLNWMGYRTDDARVFAILNHDAATPVTLVPPPLGSAGPTVYISAGRGGWQEKKMDAVPDVEIALPESGCALVVWPLASG